MGFDENNNNKAMTSGTVDIKITKNTKTLLKKLQDFIKIDIKNAITFLPQFNKKIDFFSSLVSRIFMTCFILRILLTIQTLHSTSIISMNSKNPSVPNTN